MAKYKKLKAFVRIGLLLCGFAIFFSGCGNRQASGGADSPMVKAGPAADTVPVFLLKQNEVKKTVELSGELAPFLQTDLYAKVQGYVRSMKVDIGDRVKKGQVLAVIEAPEINTQIVQSNASLEAAKAKLMSSTDRYQRLYRASLNASPGIVAPVDLVNSHNQLLADSSSYEAIRQQSKAYSEIAGYLRVAAPFDGVIIARRADPGALVNANAMLLTIQDNNHLRLRMAVPEQYVSAAGENRALNFSVDAWPEQRFSAMLTRKTETIDPATRTEIWEYDVNNTDHHLKAGAFVNARIALGRAASSFIVPLSAVVTTAERRFVIRVKSGKAEWRDIRQGLSTDAGIEIFGDLAAGDTLLTKATDERKPGSGGYWKMQ